MRRNRLANATESARLLASQFNRVLADVPAGDVAGKEPVAGLIHTPPSAQYFQQSGR
jgi:hypothetical protein